MSITEVLFHLLTIPVAFAYGGSLEWLVHKIIFHRLGKRKNSPFGFHWKDHHRATRRHAGGDPAYEGSIFAWNAYGREVWALSVGALLHLPFLWVAPAGFVALIIHGIWYTSVHRRAHLDPEWCRDHLWWHWDHHMGRNPDSNWMVTHPWLDKLLGSHDPSTPEERLAQYQALVADREKLPA